MKNEISQSRASRVQTPAKIKVTRKEALVLIETLASELQSDSSSKAMFRAETPAQILAAWKRLRRRWVGRGVSYQKMMQKKNPNRVRGFFDTKAGVVSTFKMHEKSAAMLARLLPMMEVAA